MVLPDLTRAPSATAPVVARYFQPVDLRVNRAGSAGLVGTGSGSGSPAAAAISRIAMRRQRTGSREYLQRRRSPPGIPRPVRLGRRTERRGERRLRLAQRDPACT